MNDVAKMVGISEYLNRFPDQLSGGQRQRVALARAIAVKPKIFLMDEPLSNLDAKLRVKMRTELKAIHHRTKATTIFVTHDQAEAMSMADRIVIMKDGHIVQIGTTDEVYFNCADIFVAGFIGTPPTNFMIVDINREGGNIVLRQPNFKYKLSAKLTDIVKNYKHDKLILGIRPENISIVNKNRATFAEKILVIEPQGSHQIIAVEFNDSIIKIVAPTFPKYSIGDILYLSLDVENVMLFDIETEKRINFHSFQEA